MLQESDRFHEGFRANQLRGIGSMHNPAYSAIPDPEFFAIIEYWHELERLLGDSFCAFDMHQHEFAAELSYLCR